MNVKLKPSVVRAALLGGVAAIVIAFVAHVVPVVGWLSVPLALGTGALAAILGRHEPGPALRFVKPPVSSGTSLTPGPGTVDSDSISNFAGPAPDTIAATGQDGGTPDSGATGGAASGADTGTGSDGGASGTGDSGAAGAATDSSATGAGSPTGAARDPLMDLIPPISEGLLAGILEAAAGAGVGLLFLCCSDCLSFLQAAERFALGRMFALVEQGIFDALEGGLGPLLLAAALGALGGGLGGVATGNRS